MKKSKGSEILLMIIYVCLSGFGILFSFVDTFKILFEKNTVYPAGVLFSIAIVIAVLYAKKYRICFAVVFGIAACLGTFSLKKEESVQNLQFIFEKVVADFQSYYGNGEALQQNVEELQTIGVLILLFLAVTIATCGIVCCKRAWGTLTTIGLAGMIPFCAGEEPEVRTVICFAVVLFGSAFSKIGGAKEEQQLKSGWIGLTAGLLALFVAVSTIQFPVKQVIDRSAFIKEKVNAVFDKKENVVKGYGGVESGLLGRIDQLIQGNETHLKVRLQKKPKERIYLQGYIGNRYVSNSWNEAESYQCYSWLYDRGYTYDKYHGETMTDIRNLSYKKFEQIAGETESEKDTLQIEWYAGADARYLYRPYISLYKSMEEWNKREVDTDTYLPGYMEKEYSFPYYPHSLLDELEVPEETTGLEKTYEEYVSIFYEQVEDEVRAAFGPVVNQEIQATDVDEIQKEIADLLEENTVYTLTPGRTPAGEDFAEYFFFQNKKGYCTHYATVATLMFRLKNIPARYVSGYVVEPNEFKKEKDGSYVAEVTGKSAHAWAEVYKHGKGWLPAETTPGYTRDITEENNQEAPVMPTPEDDKKTEPEKKKEKISEQVVGGFVFGAVVIGVGIAGLIGLKKYKKKQKYINRGNGDYNIKIQLLFYKIWKKLVSEKTVDKHAELDEEIVKKICRKYEKISEKEVRRMLEIVYYANFGKEDLGDEEYGFLQTILEKIE